jgi:hypothetical protein
VAQVYAVEVGQRGSQQTHRLVRAMNPAGSIPRATGAVLQLKRAYLCPRSGRGRAMSHSSQPSDQPLEPVQLEVGDPHTITDEDIEVYFAAITRALRDDAAEPNV